MSQLWNQIEEVLKVEELDAKFDLQLILNIQKKPNLFETIVASLCPQLLGHQFVKRGLVLALFGGVARHDKSTRVKSPRQIQVLIFGNHGSQKDLLLKGVHSVSPVAHYVCGNTASVASLVNRRTGTLISKQFGICCVDEFDRMQLPAYLATQEVMDHQSVTYYPIDRNSALSFNWTATAVVAAVNPQPGEYDPTLNVWQNTRINKSILTKFDLIFVLIDNPDEEMDTKLANKILKLRKGVEENALDLISHEDLRHYIGYTQNYINPVLNSEAEEEILNFCQEFSVNSITKSQTRNFEILYRLTEARARIDSRLEATKDDVEDVIEIIKHSEGKHFFACEYLTSSVNVKRNSKKKRTEGLFKLLKQSSEMDQKKEFTVTEIFEICQNNRLGFETKDMVLEAIEYLNQGGVLIKKGSDRYRLV